MIIIQMVPARLRPVPVVAVGTMRGVHVIRGALGVMELLVRVLVVQMEVLQVTAGAIVVAHGLSDYITQRALKSRTSQEVGCGDMAESAHSGRRVCWSLKSVSDTE